ncbi:MAG: hypothetical protein CVV33_09635, partial [Methanomicrobiales archaeon HGW-Methanomicrobiales-4]
MAVVKLSSGYNIGLPETDCTLIERQERKEAPEPAEIDQDPHLPPVTIVSTGGTAKAIADAGIPVRSIGDLTGFPEMMEGRVKTLHPKVHGGLLADRSKPEHLAQAEAHDIGLIDMVVVNLYPFEATV